MKRFPAYIAALAALAVLLCAGCRKDSARDGGAPAPRTIVQAPYSLYFLSDENDTRTQIVRAGLDSKGKPTGRMNILSGVNSLNYTETRDLDVNANGTRALFNALHKERHGVFLLKTGTGAVTRLFDDLAFNPEFAAGDGGRAMFIAESLNDLMLEAGSDTVEPIRRVMIEDTATTLGSISCGGGNAALITLTPSDQDYADPRGKPALLYLGAKMDQPLKIDADAGEIRDAVLSADGATLAWLAISDDGPKLGWTEAGEQGIGEIHLKPLELRAFVSGLYLSPDGKAAWMIHHQAEPLSPIEPMEGELLRVALSEDAESERLYSFENGHRMLFGDISVTPDGALYCMALVPREEAFVEDLYGPQPWDILVFDGATGEITHVERASLSGGRRPCAQLREGGKG